MHWMRKEDHKGHTVEVPDLKEEWGLGRVFKNCLGFQGEYNDFETGNLRNVFLGRTLEEAVGKMNHLRSFLW